MFSGEFACFQNDPLAGKRKVTAAVLCAVILLALIPRIAGVILYPGTLYHNDGKEYRDIAEQISMGNGFSVSGYRWYEAVPEVPETIRPDFTRPPVIPLLGAALHFLPFDWVNSARVTVLLVSILCTIAVYLLGKEISSSRFCGVLGAAFYTFYPFSIYHSICWSSENVFLVFLCFAYLYLVRCVRKNYAWKEGFLCGLLLAAASLTRPQGGLLMLLLGFSAGVLFLRFLLRKEFFVMKRLVISGLCFMLGALVLLSPWMIRNWNLTGIPQPFSFFGAYSFAQSASDITYQTMKHVDTPEYEEEARKAWDTFHQEKRDQLKALGIYSLPESNPYWKKWAWEYIRKNPGQMLESTWLKVLHSFRAAPNSSAISTMKSLMIQAYFYPLVLLMFCGIFALWKTDKPALYLILLSFASVIIFAIGFQMMLRYRYPFFAPFAGILAAYGIFQLSRWRMARAGNQSSSGV